MSRTARIKSTTGMYHIMIRGNNKQTIFEDDTDRRKFLSLLQELPKRYSPNGDALTSVNCLIYAYCLMPNHVHILYREINEEINSSMKRLLTSYARYYNTRHGRIGHLFQDRYRSEPCNDINYYTILLRYIHQNPLKANLVQNLDKYPWSSWHEYTHPYNTRTHICDTQASLKLIPIDQFIELVKDNLPDSVKCIDDNPPRGCPLSTETLELFLAKKWQVFCPADFQQYSKEMQREIMIQLYRHCASISQIAAACGKTYRQVYDVVKENGEGNRDRTHFSPSPFLTDAPLNFKFN